MLEIEMVPLTDRIPEQLGAEPASAGAVSELARKRLFMARSPGVDQLAKTSARYRNPQEKRAVLLSNDNPPDHAFRWC